MNYAENDRSQMKAVIEVTELETEKVKNQIFQLNVTLAKKRVSIDKFKEYIDIYAKTLDDLESKNIQIMKNNHSFYQHLMHVMQLECNDLDELEKIKKKLLIQYNESAKKADGLYSIYELMQKERALTLEKIEENELFDLAVLGKRLE